MKGETVTGNSETEKTDRGDEEQYRHLRALFVDITGTNVVVDEQESTLSSRCIDSPSASATRTQREKNDGPDDTIDAPTAGTPD